MKTHRNVYQNIVFLVYIHRWSGQSWVCYSFILLSYCFFLLFCHKKSCRCFLVELISHFVMLTPFITFYTIWGCSWERPYSIIVVHIHFRWFLVNSCLIGNLFFLKPYAPDVHWQTHGHIPYIIVWNLLSNLGQQTYQLIQLFFMFHI